MTANQIHWNTSELLEVPPVRLVTELDPSRLRQLLAAFVDGRQVTEVLQRSVHAIRANFATEPHAYVVVFPDHRLEVPIDLRAISDEPGSYAGIVKEPRSTNELVFDLAEVQGTVADQMVGMPREYTISAMKSLSELGDTFLLHDICDSSDRFAHVFDDGAYHHSYRYVSAHLGLE